MSLGIAVKSGEGIVLAADSRVTIFSEIQTNVAGQRLVVPATYDNAAKLLSLASQQHVGAVTFGAGAIGMKQPRTASSFLAEFESWMAAETKGKKRLSVVTFAEKLGEFFTTQWQTAGDMPPNPDLSQNMIFLVGGFNNDQPYGRLYQLSVPSSPTPQEIQAGEFGAVWGGQTELTDRLLQGFDPKVPEAVQEILGIAPANRRADLGAVLKSSLNLPIPWQFLPLQDCVDLAVFLVRTTITLQQWLTNIRGVGGAVDVATITRTDGFKALEIKQVAVQKARST